MKFTRSLIVTALVGVGVAAQAVPYYYVDWTSATSTSATGTITLPDASTITVHVTGPMAFVQTAGGTNYWNFNSSIYTSSQVSNAPNHSSDIVAIDRASTYTVTFSRPVQDLAMSIMSLGRTNLHVSYDFNHDFTIHNSGNGHWGGGTPSLFEDVPTVLRGVEGHGVIVFDGSVSTLTWVSNPSEFWHGFTFGVAGVAIPAPGAALAFGVALLAQRRRRC
ncbi:MAG TPA: hypothetical protein VM328_07210 [Fimbriimonadaceae bacterium]|nr:hypothetical protein [Fimbriimonadaceae bacterium]